MATTGSALGHEVVVGRPILPHIARGFNTEYNLATMRIVPRATLVSTRAGDITTSNCLARFIQTRGIHSALSSSGRGRRDTVTFRTPVVSNSDYFTRSAQIARLLGSSSRPIDTRQSVRSKAASQDPDPKISKGSIFVQVFEKIIQCIASLLPTRAFVEKLEDEANAAASMVEEGAKIIVRVADEIEAATEAVELRAEEVEKMAKKVAETAERIKTAVDDIADVLEGEKVASSLLQTAEKLKQASITAQEAQTKASEDAQAKLGQDTTKKAEQNGNPSATKHANMHQPD